MRIRDTLSGREEEFREMHRGRVNMFVCGPTVYDYFHLGHARTYVFFDTVAKYLRLKGYSVFYLQNITDIDDKIIKRAQEEGTDYRQVASRFLSVYMEDMGALGIDSVNLYAPSTLYMDEILSQVQRLLDSGHAYVSSDGVYFDITTFPDYGELSHQKLSELIPNMRVEGEGKRNPGDFVLWKFMKPGEPYWPSPWGDGRPGWHIEDTSITEAYFGPEYDIHGGGSDLIFPHHEDEIAQMRSISGRRHLARYWLHTGMVNVGREKMSKSLRNYVTIGELLGRYPKETVRLHVLGTGYRNTLQFDEETIRASDELRRYIQNAYYRATTGTWAADTGDLSGRVMACMDSDMDTRGAIGVVVEACREANARGVERVQEFRSFLEWADAFLGILRRPKADTGKLVENVLGIRREMRAMRMYEVSDRIRQALRESGIEIQDVGERTEWWYA